jgi:phosphoserine aminotransferase
MDTARAWNFAAGPAMLPDAVVARAREELFARGADGASVAERPFSHPATRALLEDTSSALAGLLDLPPGYQVLFLAGGAMQQFAAVPLNLLEAGQTAVYADSGYWARRAHAEAQRHGDAQLLPLSGIPLDGRAWDLPSACAYAHLTLNETADGLAWPALPDCGDVPLVADATSSFLAAPLACERFGVIYASAQKNIGPAGLTVLIVREELLQRPATRVPSVWSWRLQCEQRGCVNTPPLSAIHLAAMVFDWIADQGGVAALATLNQRKAATLYAAIDTSDGYYHAPAAPAWRSLTNVCFQLRDPARTETFITEAQSAGLYHLRGHPRLGGLRASLYNAMPQAGVDALVDFMADFQRRHG